MKFEGEAPVPETVATPFVAAEDTLHASEAAAVSASVAFNSGAAHAVGAPFSDMVTVNGPAPCAMTGAALGLDSFTSVTVTVMAWVTEAVPSPAVMISA